MTKTKKKIRKQIKKAMKTNLFKSVIVIDKILFLVVLATYSMIFFNHVIGSITVAASLTGVILVVAGGLITSLFK